MSSAAGARTLAPAQPAPQPERQALYRRTRNVRRTAAGELGWHRVAGFGGIARIGSWHELAESAGRTR